EIPAGGRRCVVVGVHGCLFSRDRSLVTRHEIGHAILVTATRDWSRSRGISHGHAGSVTVPRYWSRSRGIGHGHAILVTVTRYWSRLCRSDVAAAETLFPCAFHA